MDPYRPIVDAILTVYPDTEAVYRFGSWGTKHQRADSDLDIAVLLPHETAVDRDPEQWLALVCDLADEADTDRVDLVNLRTANTILQFEILRSGGAVYVGDEDARRTYEVLVLSKYHDLNVWRKPIVERFLNRPPTPVP